MSPQRLCCLHAQFIRITILCQAVIKNLFKNYPEINHYLPLCHAAAYRRNIRKKRKINGISRLKFNLYVFFNQLDAFFYTHALAI